MLMIFVMNNFIDFYKSDVGHVADDIFDFEGYRNSIGEDSRDFTMKFTWTQLFSEFIENYKNPKPEDKPQAEDFNKTLDIFLNGGLWSLKESLEHRIKNVLKPWEYQVSMNQAFRLYEQEISDNFANWKH